MTRATEPRAPVAAVVAGPAGVGKTTLAHALAAHLGACLLDLDTATAPLVAVVANVLGSSDLDGATLARATREARYATVRDLAAENLACGLPVVLVAPFTTERAEPAAWGRLARQLADLEAHLDRIDLRPPAVPHVAVDTGGDVDLDGLAAALVAPGR